MKKPFPLNPDYYVDTEGNIFSTKKGGFYKMKYSTSEKRPYAKVELYDDNGKGTWYSVHRLVAITHLSPARPEQIEVNHIDNNPSNNNVSNLEWCTAKENINHAARQGRLVVTNGEINGMATITEEIAYQIRDLFDSGLRTPYISKQLGVTRAIVDKIGRRERWSYLPEKSGQPYVHKKRSNARVLNEIKVKEIKIHLKNKQFNQREIAKMYNIGHALVNAIYKEKCWKHVVAE